MRIDIIGAGSLGLLLAGRLIHAGNDVRLWCRSSEQAGDLSHSGVTISYEDKRTPLKVSGNQFRAAPVYEFMDVYLGEPGDWIVITVKQNVFHSVIPELLAALSDKQPHIVCFQNGSGHMELLGELLPEACLYAAVTTEAAKRISFTQVVHAGEGEIWLGEWAGNRREKGQALIGLDSEPAIDLVKVLSLAGFSALLSKEVNTMIYRKLIINAVINPLTAIWRIPNGELLLSGHRIQLMRELYDEAIAVYEACGIACESGTWEYILEVCQATEGNTSSMLADVLSSRATEIRWINGSIVEMAERFGVAVPLNRWICRLVEGMIAEER